MDKVVQILCAVLLATTVQARPEHLHGAAVLAAPAVVAAPVVATAAVVAAPVSSQYHAQDALGQYSYGYSGGPSAKAETKTADGVVRGGYSYLDANGVVQTINYIADDYGFRVAASNLPVHVPADTPEVAAAKAAHAVAYTQAAVAAAVEPDVPQPDAAAVVAGSAAVPAVVSAVPAAVPLAVAAPVAHTVITPGVVSTTSGTSFVYSSLAAAPFYAPFYHHYAYGIPLHVNGVPLDTPEVAAAKAVHYAAHVAAKYNHHFYL